MAFDLTREGVTPVSGMYAVIPNLPQDHNVIFYAEDETATIAAGYAVQLSSTSTNTAAPVVEATTALTDIPYGFVVYDALKDAYAVGGKIAVAKTGDVNSFFQMLNTVLRATKKKRSAFSPPVQDYLHRVLFGYGIYGNCESYHSYCLVHLALFPLP